MNNTRIRGLQIRDADITVTQLANDAVETAKIKDKNVTLAKLEDGADKQLLIAGAAGVPAYQTVSGDVTIGNTGITAIGATKVTDAMINDDVATNLAGDGLAATTGVLALDLNELTGAVVAVATDSIAIVDSDDNSSKKESIADLVTAMAGTGLTATAGVLSADAITDNIVEADILYENESANCNGSNVEFTLAETPIANSVQVFQNGLLQEEGSGNDYTIAGAVITFAIAPVADDLLLVHYIQDN